MGDGPADLALSTAAEGVGGFGSMPLIMAENSMGNGVFLFVGLNCVSFLGFGSKTRYSGESPVVGCKAQ